MTEVVYAIELDTLDTTGLTMVKVKIGKTSNLESRLNNYQTGMLSEPEVLSVWYPNPDVGLSSVENGILDIAEQYSYNRNGEAFVFLQDGYQQFSENVDKLLEATTREEVRDASSGKSETLTDDYTGEGPARRARGPVRGGTCSKSLTSGPTGTASRPGTRCGSIYDRSPERLTANLNLSTNLNL